MTLITQPAKKPNTICPFTGEPLEIEYVAGVRKWRARGSFWTSAWRETKEEVLYDISTRDGVLPAFPRRPEIEVRLREEPPDAANLRAGLPTVGPIAEKIERVLA
jgi:hypothetical protein